VARLRSCTLTCHQAQDASRAAGLQLRDAMLKGHAHKSKRTRSVESNDGSKKENIESTSASGKSEGRCSRGSRRCKHGTAFDKIVLILERQDRRQEVLLEDQRRATECLIEGQRLAHEEAREAREESRRAREAQERTSAALLDILRQGLLQS